MRAAGSPGKRRRLLPPARQTLSLGLVCAFVLIGSSAPTGAALRAASAGKLSARLTKTSFASSKAGSVTLTYRFSKPSKHFRYLLTFKQGKKWKTVESVKKKGSFKGSKTTTVKKLFAGKAIKVGSYRLELFADTGSKLLGFKVVKSASPAVSIGGSTGTVTGASFTITGGMDSLEPGQTKPLELTLTNPNSVAIYVTQLTVTASADSTPSGCPSAGNLQITQSSASSGSPIAIPAKKSVTLTSAPLAPQITFLNLPDANQDACKNVSFTLTYSGSAHS